MSNVLEIISIMLFGIPEKETEAKCDFSGLRRELAKARRVAYPATKIFTK